VSIVDEASPRVLRSHAYAAAPRSSPSCPHTSCSGQISSSRDWMTSRAVDHIIQAAITSATSGSKNE
jgi:hypothetical protein